MNTAEILALCREAQSNPDYVADYPEIAMRLITEALPEILDELEQLRKVRDIAQNLFDNDLCIDLCNKYESHVCASCAGHNLEQALSQAKEGGKRCLL